MTETLETLEALRVWCEREIKKCEIFAECAQAGRSIPIGIDAEEVALFFPSKMPGESEKLTSLQHLRHMIGHALVSSIDLYRLMLANTLEKVTREIERVEVTEGAIAELSSL